MLSLALVATLLVALESHVQLTIGLVFAFADSFIKSLQLPKSVAFSSASSRHAQPIQVRIKLNFIQGFRAGKVIQNITASLAWRLRFSLRNLEFQKGHEKNRPTKIYNVTNLKMFRLFSVQCSLVRACTGSRRDSLGTQSPFRCAVVVVFFLRRLSVLGVRQRCSPRSMKRTSSQE